MRQLTATWPTTTVGTLCDQIRGVSYSKGDAQNEPADGLVAVLRANNILNDGVLAFDDLVYVPSAVVTDMQYIRKHDIVIATSSGSLTVVGKAAQSRTNWFGSFGAFCKVLRPNTTVEPRYLAYFFRTSTYRHRISHLAAGANINNLRNEHLDDLEIPLPPLSEQKRIADILDKADTIRRKRQEEIETLSALRSSIFLTLFGDPRTKRSDWPETQLDRVTILDAPMVDPKEDEYIDLVHIGPDRIEKNTGRLLPAQTAREEGLISGKFLFNERYLLYSKIRPYLRKVALPHFRGLCSADVYPIRPVEKKATREFLFALLISEAFLAYTTSLPSRASIPKLNRKELAAYTFHLPPIALQRRFAEILRSHENITGTFGKASDESEHLFNSLVKRAFMAEL